VKGQLENTERSVVEHLRVGRLGTEPRVVHASSADDDLADPVGVGGARRRLQVEALIRVVMTVEDQVGVCRVQQGPERLRATLRGA